MKSDIWMAGTVAAISAGQKPQAGAQVGDRLIELFEERFGPLEPPAPALAIAEAACDDPVAAERFPLVTPDPGGRLPDPGPADDASD